MIKPLYVPGEGSRSAKIVLVGEAPGAHEEKQGRPFVGYSGQILRDTLARTGIATSSVYITNVCHYRPPGNRIERWLTARGKILVPNELVVEGIVELYQDLAEIRPTVVVPFGNVALWALCGVQSISKRRGSILAINWDLPRARVFSEAGALTHDFLDDIAAVQGIKVIPTFHPAYVLRQMEHLAVFQTDLARVSTDSEFPELRIPEREIIIDPPESDLRRYVDRLLSGSRISYDIECVGYRLYCIGFANDPSWALTLTDSSQANRQAMRDLLNNPIPKIAQNGLFDWTFLTMFTDITVSGFEGDTMVAQHASYPSLPKGLDFLCSVYTREPYYKDEGKNWNPRDASDVERFLTYNAKDVCATLEVWDKQSTGELTDPGYRVTYDRVMSQMPVYAEQIVRGIRIDLAQQQKFFKYHHETWQLLQKGLDEAALVHLTEIFKVAKDRGSDAKAKAVHGFITERAPHIGTEKGAINVNSTKILKTLFYTLLGMKVKKDPKTGNATTNEDALKELYAETNNPILLTVVKIRQNRKRISSYLQIKTDGRGVTRFSVNPVKTKTGRSSYGKTIIGEGLNMQTVPHELRQMYIPDAPGYKFAYCDLDQAEARIVAYAGGITRMIECFEKPQVKYTETDVHSLTAHMVLGIPYENLSEYPHRYLGKRCNHAFNYEMGPEKFYKVVARDAADTGVSLTRKEAKRLRARHLQTYPELMRYWEDIRSKLRHDRTLVNPMGRKRVFLGRLDADTFREAFSHFAQSTVADVLRTGMVAAHQQPVARLRELGYEHTRVVLEVHDALLIQYPEEAEDEFLSEVVSCMTIPFEVEGREITIPIGVESGWNWGERDPEKNPNGLEKYAGT